MAATIDISCPECGNKSKAPADLVGKKIRCKACQAVFPVQAATPKKPTKPEPAKAPVKAAAPAPANRHADAEIDRNPYIMREENLAARCPFCALPLDPPDAKICIHCGYDMVKRKRVESKKTYEITGADYFTYHIPTIICVIGNSALLGFNIFCLLNASSWMKDSWFDNGDGTYMVKPGIIPLYCFLISLVGFVPMTRLLIKRLINFTPPEKVKHEHNEE